MAGLEPSEHRGDRGGATGTFLAVLAGMESPVLSKRLNLNLLLSLDALLMERSVTFAAQRMHATQAASLRPSTRRS